MVQSQEFDWVRARSRCNAGQIFNLLRLGAELDVRTRMETLPKGANYSFAVQPSDNMFLVALNADRAARSVIFELRDDVVVVRRVRDGKEDTWEVKPTINDDGECRLKVGSKEYRCWQFRKMVLEDLLFDNPWC